MKLTGIKRPIYEDVRDPWSKLEDAGVSKDEGFPLHRHKDLDVERIHQ